MITNKDIPKKRQRGGEEDVVKAWGIYYKSQGWDKIARFDNKGRLGVPYLLFKAKNVTDPEVRKKKWDKARPIAPTFRHPMRALLHLVGIKRCISLQTRCRRAFHNPVNEGRACFPAQHNEEIWR